MQHNAIDTIPINLNGKTEEYGIFNMAKVALLSSFRKKLLTNSIRRIVDAIYNAQYDFIVQSSVHKLSNKCIPSNESTGNITDNPKSGRYIPSL
jgi:hypothetical protein